MGEVMSKLSETQAVFDRTLCHIPRKSTTQTIPPLEVYLANVGLLSQDEMMRVITLKTRHDATSFDILYSQKRFSSLQLSQYQAVRLNLSFVDTSTHKPDVTYLRQLSWQRALRYHFLPLGYEGKQMRIACADPDVFEQHKPYLTRVFGSVRCVVSCRSQITNCILSNFPTILTQRAEKRLLPRLSCRTLTASGGFLFCYAIILIFLMLYIFMPFYIFDIMILIAVLFKSSDLATKIVVCFLHYAVRPSRIPVANAQNIPDKLPCVSILVSLYKEANSVQHLLYHLKKLNYPKDILEIVLIIEQTDAETHKVLQALDLPNWIWVLSVPKGSIQTKPRALNYALDHCRGTIIGVYDAEDIPAPQQINDVVQRFRVCDPKVVCLQGRLDFYNTYQNILSRCFSIEYAAWFRVFLKGLQKLGLILPLGGTTLFFKRDVLERIGAWDAHNVTEDADLGIRLARFGYRTELLPTITKEEANCALWAWVRQRSRWIKGYMLTWAVHMRQPYRLWQELGMWRFFGVQVLFGSAILSFLLSPFLWLLCVLAVTTDIGLHGFLSQGVLGGIMMLFLISMLVNIVMNVIAIGILKKRALMLWLWVMPFYYFLMCVAAYKGLFQIFYRPFFWDKTEHGSAQMDVCDDPKMPA